MALDRRRRRKPAMSSHFPPEAVPEKPRPQRNAAPVAIVGGGLAGLAAAVGLAGRGLKVELFEARRRLGGRAASFRDDGTGELIDHCQHVSMGCCTNLADFYERTGLAEAIRCDDELSFFDLDGHRYRFMASRWLPAPLHLAPSLFGLGYLSLRDRISVARALWRLGRMPRLAPEEENGFTIGRWLRDHDQSERAIEFFWSVVLVSALGETVERASLAHARKVFVDGFMAHRRAYHVHVPRVPLSDLYGGRLIDWLREQGVTVRAATPVTRVDGDGAGVTSVELADGTRHAVDAAILAVPWSRVRAILSDELLAALPVLEGTDVFEAVPITAVHLWFDRPIMNLPHAVLVGRLSQWIFYRGGIGDGRASRSDVAQKPPEKAAAAGLPATSNGHYYQVVISASRELAGRDRGDVLRQVIAELSGVWPVTKRATLLRWRMVTQHEAVFSTWPGIDQFRPRQRTPIANLALAGDWTRTGWPATMEGAVRSGYLAAEAILEAFGEPATLVVEDLPRGPLARLVLA